MEIPPYLMQPGKLKLWIDFSISILDYEIGQEAYQNVDFQNDFD